MTTCADIRDQIAYYVDDELHEPERERFEAHVASCPSCATALDVEFAFVERLRGERPYAAAPAPLRAAVAAIVGSRREIAPRRRRAVAAVAAALVIAVTVAVLVTARRAHVAEAPVSKFAAIAVDVHERRLRGNLPLEIVSAAPDLISDWFAGKVPFGLKLPNYQEVSGQNRLYELEGARLVGFEDDYAAYVAYRMGDRQISLVVTSSAAATPAGGDEVEAKGLLFHCEVVDGLKVITWADRGLTYALVSDLEERGQQSCVVCHEGTRDRDFIERLKPVT